MSRQPFKNLARCNQYIHSPKNQNNMKTLSILFLSTLLFFSSCKKDCTTNCNDCDTTRFYLKPFEICCMSLDCPKFGVMMENGEEAIITNLNEFDLSSDVEYFDACIETIAKSNPVQIKIKCIKNITKNKVITECGCLDKIKLHLVPFDAPCNRMIQKCPQFAAFYEDGSPITIINWEQFNLENVEQDVMVCLNDVQAQVSPPAYTADCVEKITLVKDQYDPLPCEYGASKGVILTKENYGGGCGDWYIKTETDVFFPVNAAQFSTVYANNTPVFFNYEMAEHPCNSAKGIKLTCLKPDENK